MIREITLSVVLCGLLASFSFAQESRATVTGHVTDSSGALMPKVKIQITNVATNEVGTVVSNTQGTYTLPFLKPGVYNLSAEAAGFKTYLRRNIQLNVGATVGVDVQMEIGQSSESVTVSAETPVLETENADRAMLIDQTQVSELPLNARNPFMLSILSPGTNFNGQQIYQRPFDNGAIAEWSVNGGQERKNEYLLDGAPNNAQAGGNNIALVPPVDSVQEFKIQTNSYDAAYGKSSGGIMNVSLKSGTNDFHGTVYEFMRRSSLDANSFQNNAVGAPKAGHFLDQYGPSLGGPIWIPKIYDGRNKAFFFVNYEGYREGTPTPLTLSVPEPEFLNGDFSKLVDSKGKPITIYNPYSAVINADGSVTRQPFAGNQLPASMINPIAQNILGYEPKPNQTALNSNYSKNNLFIPGGSANLDRDSFYNLVTKFDFNLGQKNHLFFREASNDRTEERNTNGVHGPGYQGPGPLKRINDAYILDWTSTLSPTLILDMKGSFARYVEGSRSDPNIGINPTVLGFPQSLVSQLPVQDNFGVYSFSGYTGLGGSSSFNYTNTTSYGATVTKISGKHTIRSGMDLRWVQYNTVSQGNPFNISFSPTWTKMTYNALASDTNSGDSIASALLGLPSSGSVDNNIYSSYLNPYYAFYTQDDWKLSRKLTVNIGLRWDFIVPPTERYSRNTYGFDPDATNPLDSQIDRTKAPGFPAVKGGLVFDQSGQGVAKLDKTGIQPRIGFAYSISSKLVMRGGWGRYMINPSNAWNLNNGYSRNTPLTISADSNKTPINPVDNQLLNNLFPSGILQPTGSSLGLGTGVGTGITFFDPNFKIPYVNQFSFGFQYQLPLDSRVEISYNGNRSHKLQSSMTYNSIPLSLRQQCNPLEGGISTYCDQTSANPFYHVEALAGTTLYSSPTRPISSLGTPYPEFSSITEAGRNDGKIWYNSLQATYTIRRKGLNATFAYTHSKNIEQSGILDPLTGTLQRQLSSNDQPNMFKLSTVYQLPFGHGKKFLANANRLIDALIGGWEHTMIFQYSTGRPWGLPGNVRYMRDAQIPVDWNTPSGIVTGVNACVASMSDTGAITLTSASASVPGCSLSSYNFLVLPRFAPNEAPSRDPHIRGQARPSFDMSVGKTFRITEKKSFQFRAEGFNVFNAYWMTGQSFNNSATGSTFGTITKSAVAQGNTNFSRQIQLGFKFIF
jgi:hypothetical protein